MLTFYLVFLHKKKKDNNKEEGTDKYLLKVSKKKSN